jgi:pentatricopeptide repeat protein
LLLSGSLAEHHVVFYTKVANQKIHHDRLRIHNAVANACVKAAKWEHALSIFQQAQDPNAVPQMDSAEWI